MPEITILADSYSKFLRTKLDKIFCVKNDKKLIKKKNIKEFLTFPADILKFIFIFRKKAKRIPRKRLIIEAKIS